MQFTHCLISMVSYPILMKGYTIKFAKNMDMFHYLEQFISKSTSLSLDAIYSLLLEKRNFYTPTNVKTVSLITLFSEACE